MSIAHLLPDFSRPSSAASDPAEAISSDDERLAIFEEGYRAGWDDSVKAQADERKSVSADLARNLRDLSFTYHEAYTAMANSVKPLIEQVVRVVLPKMAHASLGAHIAEQISAAGMPANAPPVVVRVAPDNREAVDAVLGNDTGLPVIVESDAMLGSGQAQLRFSGTEKELDLDAVIASVGSSVDAYFHGIQQEEQNG